MSYADFRDGSAQRVCVEQGKCTLAPPVVVEGSHSDPTECDISSMDYDPPAHENADGEQVFPEGATVTVSVSCLRFSDPDGDGVEGDSSEGDSSEGDSSEGDSSDGDGSETDGTGGDNPDGGDGSDTGTSDGSTPSDEPQE